MNSKSSSMNQKQFESEFEASSDDNNLIDCFSSVSGMSSVKKS